MKFVKGKRYRHKNTFASLDIRILSVFSQNKNRTVAKVQYLTKWSNRVQYLGDYKYCETIRISNQDDWHEAHNK